MQLGYHFVEELVDEQEKPQSRDIEPLLKVSIRTISANIGLTV
jgi:hypothetical protein